MSTVIHTNHLQQMRAEAKSRHEDQDCFDCAANQISELYEKVWIQLKGVDDEDTADEIMSLLDQARAKARKASE